MGSASKKVVKKNVLSLLGHAAGGKLPAGESGVTRLKKLNITQGSAQRVLDDESDLRLDTLDQLARGFGMRAWQLLVPKLDPAAPPTLATGGSPIEPPSQEGQRTDPPTSGDEAEAIFDGLDANSQALLGDIISIVRRRLLERGEETIGRDASWGKEESTDSANLQLVPPSKPAKGRK